MSPVLKKITVILSALLIFVGSLIFENSFAKSTTQPASESVVLAVGADSAAILNHLQEKISVQAGSRHFLGAGDIVETMEKTGVVLEFGNYGLVRLAPYSKLEVKNLDMKSGSVFFELKSGRAWVNSKSTLNSVNILVGNVLLIPHQAILDVNNLNDRAEVFVQSANVEVGLIGANYKSLGVVDFVDQTFVNGFVIVGGNKVQLYFDKIKNNEDILKKLLVSKLLKEFPVGLFSKNLFDDWIKNNIRKDQDELTNKLNAAGQALRNSGLITGDLNALSYQFGQVLAGVFDQMVLVKSKLLHRIIDRRFNLVHDAKYFYLFTRNAEAEDRMQAFMKLIDEDLIKYGDEYRELFFVKLFQDYEPLLVFGSDDPIVEVRKDFDQIILKHYGHSDLQIQRKFLVLGSGLNEVYEEIEQNPQLAFQLLEDYYKNFNDLVKADGSRFSRVKSMLAQENLVWNDMLLRFPQMYHDRFFLMKSTLEQTWLNLLAAGVDKNEERQAFISAKIDYLRQLKTFFLDGKIAQIDDAKKIVARLFREIDDLQQSAENKEAQVAVNDLFAQRLQDFGSFFRYLNTPEYVATTLHGAARNDQFNAFMQALQEQVTIDDLRQEILGSQPVAVVSVGQILDLVQTDLSKSGIINLRLGSIGDSSQRFIAIQGGRLEGVDFQAQYDWDQHILEDVVVNGAIISKEAVKLENLAVLLKAKMELDRLNQPLDEVVVKPEEKQNTVVEPQLSRAEKVAKILLIQKFKSSGVLVGESNIQIIDLTQNYFGIKNAVLVSDNTKAFDFKYFGKQGILTGLVVHKTKTDVASELKTMSLIELVPEVTKLFQ